MKVGQSKNQCGACKEYFNSNSAFEKHRHGQYGVDRRCMTPDEMTGKLMEKNAGGYWITEPRIFEREPDAIQEQSRQTA